MLIVLIKQCLESSAKTYTLFNDAYKRHLIKVTHLSLDYSPDKILSQVAV